MTSLAPRLLGDVASPPVTLHRLLTAWQFGDWSADVALAVLVCAAATYLEGVILLHRKGRRWPTVRSASFLFGLFLVAVAVVSGLASYDDSEFTVHIIQHLVLMMLAPPLLALGAPLTLVLQAYPRSVQTRLLRLLHSAPVRIATTPLLAAAAYYLSMWVELQTSFYPYSLEHPLVHDASHLVMLVLGCLFWWPVVATDELPRRPAIPVRLGLVLVGVPFEAFLGISIMSMGTTIAPQHTLADTHRGGAVFWACSMLIMLFTTIVVASQWMRQEERRASRADRRLERSGTARDRQGPQWAARSDFWEAAWEERAGQVPSSGP